ncbi:TetR/AcrR family transcriptional regulator [Tabrizicola sp.]|uniref:TetR/AcrR family transcriptional regulator n=1 Tax=Tabrizicola sp. TaxID=2005166 RepID=UPI003F3B63D1
MVEIKRLSSSARLAQLLDTARLIVREEGAEALTLIRLAERSGVSKPIAYRHFKTRENLLAMLYREFDERQTVSMRDALAAGGRTLDEVSRTVAASYIDCTLAAGAEIPWIFAALQTSPELQAFWRECRAKHHSELEDILERASGKSPGPTTTHAILGAADALAAAAASGEVDRTSAIRTLAATIAALATANAEQGGN